MPPVNLGELANDEVRMRTMRANSFNTRLTLPQFKECLSRMGTVMSTYKLSRKIAVVAVILYDLNQEEDFTAHYICTIANEKYVQARQHITPTIVGSIMRLCERWGLVRRVMTHKNHYVYRKVIE